MSQFILMLAAALILGACQVKEESSSGLIAGHRPAENSFVISLPSNGNYKAAQVLNFTLTHPYIVDVVGTPRIPLTIGGSTVYANYVSGTGSKVLTFSYTIQPGDNDSDGIAVGANLGLPGGATIKFNTSTDVPTNLYPASTANIRVDTSAPTILSATNPLAIHYYTGHTFIFTVTFSESVIVSGAAPSIDFDLNQCEAPTPARTKKATYTSGSGTNTLTFAYSVENHCNDENGIPVNPVIQLNGGTIADAATNPAATTTALAAMTATTRIRGRYPLISNITPPANGTYTPGAPVDFVMSFDRPVTITGTPASYINLTVGVDATKQAQFLSQPTTSSAIFRYVPIGGDVDSDGIALSGSIENEGNICATATAFCLNNVTDIFTPPVTPGVIVYAPIPTIQAIQLPSPLPASGWYKLGDSVQVVVRYSEPVNVTVGTPLLHAVVGATNRTFTYLSGSGTQNLIFQYTIQNTDLDIDGVAFTGPLDLNGALIQNAALTNANTAFTYTLNAAFRFDGVVPTITGSALVANTPSATRYRLSNRILVDITFSEIVTVAGSNIPYTINGVTRNATVDSGSGTNTVRFGYTVATGDHLSNQAAALTIATAISAAGTIRDVALNDIVDRTFPTIPTGTIAVDGAIPTVTTTFGLPANGNYKNADVLEFTVNFSEPMAVTGTPTWNITLTSGGPGVASYVSGTGTNALLFRYTVGAAHVDANGIVMTNSFGGVGTITDASVGNSLAATFTPPTVAATSGINVDGSSPTVSSIAGAAGTFIENQYTTFTVTYSEPVTITGNPQLVLDIAGQTKYADYVSGSGFAAVTYRYQVETGLQDTSGVQVTSHILNMGTIADTSGNNAVLTITPQNFASVLVDSQEPTLLSITAPTNGVRVTGNTISVSAVYDEDVTVNTAGGTPTITLDIGGQNISASYASGSGSTTLVFTTLAMTEDEFDVDGISLDAGSVALNGGTIRDAQAHNGVNTYSALAMPNVKVIYSSVRSWLDMSTTSGGTISTVTSSSPSGVGAGSSGTVTRIAADANFNNAPSALMAGTEYLTISSITAKTIFVLFKTDATPSLNSLVRDASVGIQLFDGSSIGYGANARLAANGGNFGGASTFCVGCYAQASTRVLTLDFSSAQSMSSVRIGDFEGRVAEVWILDNSQSLTDAQKYKIRDYLNSKH